MGPGLRRPLLASITYADEYRKESMACESFELTLSQIPRLISLGQVGR